MGPLTFAMLVGLTAGIMVGCIKVIRTTKKKKSQQRIEDTQYENEQQQLLDLTLNHFEPLKENLDKSIYTDEYGTKHYDKWEKEISRFFKSVGYESETYTPSQVAKLIANFIHEHSKELEEAK